MKMKQPTKFLIQQLQKQLSDGREEENIPLREYVRKTFPQDIVTEIFSSAGIGSSQSSSSGNNATETTNASTCSKEINDMASKLILPGLDNRKEEKDEDGNKNFTTNDTTAIMDPSRETTIIVSNSCVKTEKRDHPKGKGITMYYFWGLRVEMDKALADCVEKITYNYTYLGSCDKRRTLVRSKNDNQKGIFESTDDYSSWGLYAIKVRIYFLNSMMIDGEPKEKILLKHDLDFELGKLHSTYHSGIFARAAYDWSSNGNDLKFDSKESVLRACSKCGQALQYAPSDLQADKEIVTVACSNDGMALQFASEQLKNDKEVVFTACSQNGNSLQYASNVLQNDKDIVLKAISETIDAVKYASKGVQKDKDVFLSAHCQQDIDLKKAPRELHNCKEVVMAACSQDGKALEFASWKMKNEKDVVLRACSKDGDALRFASERLRNDKEIVLQACSQNGSAFQFASSRLLGDKEVLLTACSQDGAALKHATRELQCNKEVVLAACLGNGLALQHASEAHRADKEVVMAAVESKPESLKFALGGLNQDKDCLIKAKLWDENHVDRNLFYVRNSSKRASKKIVLSTKFSLSAESSDHATRFTLELKKNPFIAEGSFIVYSPNAFNKGTCDPNWTDKTWPCRGTYSSCQKPSHLKTGRPKESECCWRYSFRWHLHDASRWGGFMIQVVDFSNNAMKLDAIKESYDDNFTNHNLGNGQAIESEMAQDVGIKVFRFFEPPPNGNRSITDEVDHLVGEIQKWYAENCRNMAECNVLFGSIIESAFGEKLESLTKAQSSGICKRSR